MKVKIRIFLVLFWTSMFAQATPLLPSQVPDPLKPWIDWVLQDQAELGCPFNFQNYVQKRCSAPSRLDMDFGGTAGKFSIDWQVYRENWITLPGNETHWPQNVTANGKNLAVVERNGLPAAKLGVGNYHIQGEFNWPRIPESLNVPPETGLIKLRVNGADIALPNVRDGQLWLTVDDTGRKPSENVQNNLDVEVFRLITDEVPMQITTRLVLKVSGEQREIRLAKPLLDGFTPLALASSLPARIEPDGQLLVQVRPGQWQIDITGKNNADTTAISLGKNLKEWPESEIWVFDARPDLRTVEVDKLAPIDASQTNAPQEWRHLPAYSINQGESLTLKLIRRGDPEPEANQLTLQRKLWLDFDGGGYTISDAINGKMRRDWRLDALAEMQVGRANLNGGDQLITLNAVSGQQGVEVRQGVLSLTADSRKTGNIGSLSAVGWQQNFNSVQAELNLPPGWRLLAASGVDNVPDTWLSRWTLLDLFLVLIAALAVSRLFGRNWGLFAAITLALSWHESGAPHTIWLNILAAVALIKVLPPGRFLLAATWYRNLGWLSLVLVLIPFLVDQIRIGIYPQLEYARAEITPPPAMPSQSQSGNAVEEVPAAMKALAPPVASPEADLAESDSLIDSETYSVRSYAKSKVPSKRLMKAEDSREDYKRFDPDAKIQTGPGLPQWRWHRVLLTWNGSVDAAQHLSLWYLPPAAVMLLNFFRVILLCILALVLFGLKDKLRFKPPLAANAWFWLALLPLLSLHVPEARADFPAKEVLEELKNRLLEAPDCLPGCAQIPEAKITLTATELQISLSVHAQQAVNVPLPSFHGQWLPDRVELDGHNAPGLFRHANQLWLQVEPGDHGVVLSGRLPDLPSFTLPLSLKPKQIAVVGSSWQVSGIQDNGQIESQLQFDRVNQSQTQGDGKQLASGTLPPYVRVQRSLQLNLDWRVVTTVERLSPADSAIVLKIPLLRGEKITTPGITVKDQQVEMNLPAQQGVLSWESSLDKASQIELNAANTSQWSEVWQADVSPVWHLSSQGIPAMRLNADAGWLPEWHPWPDESLHLKITRPRPVAGQVATIDNSRLLIKPGKRITAAELNFNLRSSQGMQHTLTLPDKAVVQALTVNGQSLPPRQEGGKITLPVNPGEQQVSLSWQQPEGIGMATRTPSVDLGLPSVNSKLGIELGRDRWVLLVWGPKLGPAVLFWGVIVVILIVSAGLGKIPLTPLKSWQWALLFLGLSQMPLEAGSLVVVWLMLLGWRGGHPPTQRRYFNLLQVLLGLLTLASLAVLLITVQQGLLGGSPDMQISGNQSSAHTLNWYQDRTNAALPRAMVVSVPVLAYRLVMLAWAFWLAASLLDWLKWGWRCFAEDGFWRKKTPAGDVPKTP